MSGGSPARLSVVSGERPDPPYGPEVKANGYRPFLDWQRVKASKTWRLCDPEARNALLRLWLEAWNEVPCGSWEPDDAIIAAAIDLPLRLFTAHRDQLLRGWYLAADGRLYHPFIAAMVREMLRGRAVTAQRQRKYREARPPPPDPATAACHALLTRESRVSNGADRTGQDLDKDSLSTSPPESREGVQGENKPSPQPRGARLSSLGLTGIPSDWADFCRRERPDLDPARTWAKFVDYWEAQPGAKGIKLDWLRTWRNWVRNERGEKEHGRPVSAVERRAAINAEWQRRGQRAYDEMVGGAPDPL